MPDIGVVDLFSGVGGTSYGFKSAGLSISLGIDIDPNCEHAFDNSIGAPFLAKDIAQVAASEIEGAWNGSDVKVLAGCAPCQPFSTYTQGRHASKDPRWHLLSYLSDLTLETKPDIVAIENVPQIGETDVFQNFATRLRATGYSVECFIADAFEFGVPQHRRRLVALASRFGPIGHLEAPDDAHESPRTVREVIARLPKLAAGETDDVDPLHTCSRLSDLNLARIRSSRPGGTWRDWPESLRADCHRRPSGRTYPSVYGRMEWDKPSPTITGQCYGFGNGRFGHPDQDRAISLREAALLQSFPSDYDFWPAGRSLSLKHVGLMIGNAVPPKLAEGIGKTIKNHVHAVS